MGVLVLAAGLALVVPGAAPPVTSRSAAPATAPVRPPPGTPVGHAQPGGGGFAGPLAVDASGTTITVGGDVWGVFTGTRANAGSAPTWRPSNDGLEPGGSLRIAALTAPDGGYQWAAAGQMELGTYYPSATSLLGRTVATDGTVGPWRTVATDARVAGNGLATDHTYCGGQLPARRVRATGDLIGVDTTRDLLYLGTLDRGVRSIPLAVARARADGDGPAPSWTIVAGTDDLCVRDLTLDPSGDLYVAAYHRGDVQVETDTARVGDRSGVFHHTVSSGRTTHLATSPRLPEVLEPGPDGIVYVAAARGRSLTSDGDGDGPGVWAIDTESPDTVPHQVLGPSVAGTWRVADWSTGTVRENVEAQTMPNALAATAGVPGDPHELWAAFSNPPEAADGDYATVVRGDVEVDRAGGSASVTVTTSIGYGRDGFDGSSWWRTVDAPDGNQSVHSLPGRWPSFHAGDLLLVDDGVLMSSQGGTWWLADRHDPGDRWQPAMDGLAVTVLESLAPRLTASGDPTDDLAVGAYDYGALRSRRGWPSDVEPETLLPPVHPCSAAAEVRPTTCDREPDEAPEPEETADNIGWSLAWSVEPNREGIAMGTGRQTVANGQVWFGEANADFGLRSNGDDQDRWVPLAGPGVVGHGESPPWRDARPMAMTIVGDDLLVAYTGGGLWRARLRFDDGPVSDGTRLVDWTWARVSDPWPTSTPTAARVDLVARSPDAVALFDAGYGMVTIDRDDTTPSGWRVRGGADPTSPERTWLPPSTDTGRGWMVPAAGDPERVLIATGGSIHAVDLDGRAREITTTGATGGQIGPIDSYRVDDAAYLVGVTTGGRAVGVSRGELGDLNRPGPLQVTMQRIDSSDAAGAVSAYVTVPTDLAVIVRHDEVRIHVASAGNGLVTFSLPAW
ncbi:hypothetical protein BH23ACT2_BH23ACT2_30180 [soil metagenome]